MIRAQMYAFVITSSMNLRLLRDIVVEREFALLNLAFKGILAAAQNYHIRDGYTRLNRLHLSNPPDVLRIPTGFSLYRASNPVVRTLRLRVAAQWTQSLRTFRLNARTALRQSISQNTSLTMVIVILCANFLLFMLTLKHQSFWNYFVRWCDFPGISNVPSLCISNRC